MSVLAIWGSQNFTQATFLAHAEAHSIIRAANRSPGVRTFEMFVDRPTCNFCQNQLKFLLQTLDLDEVIIRAGSNLELLRIT